jgi:hypothetical protein
LFTAEDIMAATTEATEGNQKTFAIVHLRFRASPARAGLLFGGWCQLAGDGEYKSYINHLLHFLAAGL